MVLDRISVGAVRAMEEVASDPMCTVAGRIMRVHKLSTELNALYMMESMLKSPVVLEAAKMGLELHAAILNESTGVVDFVGQHPVLEHLLYGSVSNGSKQQQANPDAPNKKEENMFMSALKEAAGGDEAKTKMFQALWAEAVAKKRDNKSESESESGEVLCYQSDASCVE